MDRWVRAGVVDNRFEGDRAGHVLKEAEIPYLIKSFQDTAYDGLFVFQKGWAMVLVPEAFREEAKRLLAEVKKTFEKERQDEVEEHG